MSAKQPKPWFAAKSYGYGSGSPIAWQGWLVLALYLGALILAVIALPPFGRIAAVSISTALLIAVCANRTEGGWRWRNGR